MTDDATTHYFRGSCGRALTVKTTAGTSTQKMSRKKEGEEDINDVQKLITEAWPVVSQTAFPVDEAASSTPALATNKTTASMSGTCDRSSAPQHLHAWKQLLMEGNTKTHQCEGVVGCRLMRSLAPSTRATRAAVSDTAGCATKQRATAIRDQQYERPKERMRTGGEHTKHMQDNYLEQSNPVGVKSSRESCSSRSVPLSDVSSSQGRGGGVDEGKSSASLKKDLYGTLLACLQQPDANQQESESSGSAVMVTRCLSNDDQPGSVNTKLEAEKVSTASQQVVRQRCKSR
ncbi:hypothetical protein CEUSTIGMA_g1897.t1 [Chlamydomonas eustigma]|uniref:Uncharacterized protein n=1 Tax=Chlamydomonas eustigma TaxID=1157962 RepID=A0A250WUF8_9CHLO|nr:hypothetical protein CEUSTIGMA_g1897.t1 [Chlamydomonas eustigma]|eukprot:GAX74448.1 hypothetical protein CEUSTIGMA_g1897.t1 [Chlamydomonas eustigma]